MIWSLVFLLAIPQVISAASTPEPAPANCRRLATDADWPVDNLWKAALPGVEARTKVIAGKGSPDYRYRANTVEKIQKAVQFASENNVRLSILNSGHDFIGRSDAPSGLSLRISGMKGIRVNPSYAATAEGLESVNYTTKPGPVALDPAGQASATVGAGVNWDELNAALKPYKLYSTGAAHGSVAIAGGWAQSGGHAPASSYFGLAVDNILEYKIVTADGKLRVANNATNQDLFWALRGGGGGTWGVVTEATIKVFPAPSVSMYRFFLNATDFKDEDSILSVAQYFCSQVPMLNEVGGLQGYFYVRTNAISSDFYLVNEFNNATRINAIIDPILDKMSKMPGMNPKTLIKQTIPLAGPSGMVGMAKSANGVGAAAPAPALGGGGMAGAMAAASHTRGLRTRHAPGGEMEAQFSYPGILDQDSLLMGVHELTHPNLSVAMKRAQRKGDDGVFRAHLVAGNRVSQLGLGTSLTPVWRRALVHWMLTGNDKVYADSLRELSPKGQMGAYINEAWHKQPDWKQAFWGSNYPRLLSIKQKYDPDNLFWVTPGVGADLLTVKQGRLCKATEKVKVVEGAVELPPDSDNVNSMDYGREPPNFPLLYAGEGKAPISLYTGMLAGALDGSRAKENSKGITKSPK